MLKNSINKITTYRKFLYLVIFNSFFVFTYIIYNSYFHVNKVSSSSNIKFSIIEEEISNFNNSNDSGFNYLIKNRTVIKEDYYDEIYYKLLLDYIKKWKDSLNKGNTPLKTHLSNIHDAHRLIVKEQELAEFNVTKRPVDLNKMLNCSKKEYSVFLDSTYRDKPAKVIDLIMISYELVVVEMRLFELYDIVDEIIIFETNITFKQVAKPFFFLSSLHRYQRFVDKITLMTPFNITRFNRDLTIKSQINISIDDIPIEYRTDKKAPDIAFHKDDAHFFKIDFTIEQRARMMPLNLYEKYVRKLDDEEIVIHGDIDEMPSGTIINHFKHCNVLDKYPYQFWSTFYIYGFNYLFRADFAAPGDPYSNAYPNIFRMKDIRKLGRLRVNEASLLPRASGCHCNRFFSGFTISLYKDMSQSDSEGLEEFHSTIIQNSTMEACLEIKKKFAYGKVYQKYFNRMQANDKPKSDALRFIPWIVEANRHIYKQYIK